MTDKEQADEVQKLKLELEYANDGIEILKDDINGYRMKLDELKEENDALFETSKLNADLVVHQENIIRFYEKALKEIYKNSMESDKPGEDNAFWIAKQVLDKVLKR